VPGGSLVKTLLQLAVIRNQRSAAAALTTRAAIASSPLIAALK